MHFQLISTLWNNFVEKLSDAIYLYFKVPLMNLMSVVFQILF